MLTDEKPFHLGEKSGLEARLMQAIAVLPPRGVQKFDAYVDAIVKRMNDGATATRDEVVALMRGDADVIAELRRKQKLYERAALFEGLCNARTDARDDWSKARSELGTACVGPCTAPSWKPSAVNPCTLARTNVEFEELTRVARYANWPQYRTPKDNPAVPASTNHEGVLGEKVEGAVRAFYTIQSTPSLARAFLLAIDVTIDPATMAAALADAPFGHVCVAIGLKSARCQPRPWTLFSMQRTEPNRFFFGPATRGEASSHTNGEPRRNTTRQWRGLMVMGFGASDQPADHVPRFDITSLDVRTALELELQRRSIAAADNKAAEEVVAAAETRTDSLPQDMEALQASVRAAGAAQVSTMHLAPGQNPESEGDELEDEGDRQDVGLTILDRGLAFEAIRKMVAKREMTRVEPEAAAVCSDGEGPAVVLDAEDLTTGFPGTSTFDDRLRGRSLAQRRANWWPQVGNPAGAPADSADQDRFLPSTELFGFKVAPDGSVTLDTAEVVLLRAEGLPRPEVESCTRRLSLRALFEGQQGDIRVTERHVFPDGKARRMQVYVNSLPRTGEFMRTADRRLREGDPWIGTEGLTLGDLARGETLLAADQSRISRVLDKASPTVDVVLPATIRPAKPDAPAPEPGLTIYPPDGPELNGLGRLVRRQTSTIRIRLGREWFSSGDDERLGIVLWPPYLTREDSRLLTRNLSLLRSAENDPGRRIDLNATDGETLPFEDDFLGSGGRFVSRRGADPVRESVPHRQILLAPWDFPDLDRNADDPRRAELVRRVEMPLSDESNAEAGSDVSEPPPMQAALLTYRPRFDVEAEEWFVDVDLRDADTAEVFVRFGLVRYQPHTRPALRCSRPVAQYVVPLPGRTAEVWRRPEGDGLRIRVSGPTFDKRRFSEALQRGLAGGTAGAPTTAEGLGSGVVEGPEAAPWMVLSFHRNGRDAAGRPYAETVPLPVPRLGRDAGLLLPLDHDMGVLDGSTPIAPTLGTLLAGSVSIKPFGVYEGEGIWAIDVLDAAIGDLDGLSLTIREVIADEPATPPTREELARVPVPSLSARPEEQGTVEACNVSETGSPGQTAPEPPPGTLVPGRHTGGTRFDATFDLSLLASPNSVNRQA